MRRFYIGEYAEGRCHQMEATKTLAILRGPPIDVLIDIKPGGEANRINPNSRGMVSVALLGSQDFDVMNVDVTTLAFGPDGASPEHDLTDSRTLMRHLRDVDRDGFEDLLSHYWIPEVGITFGDAEICLTGEICSREFEGCDAVTTVPQS